MGKADKKRPKDEELELEDEVEADDDDDDETEEAEEVEEADDSEDADKPAKKNPVPKGLVPREPVKVPKDVAAGASKEVKALLKQREELMAKGDKKGLRKIRMALRKQGFRLSNISGQPAPKKKEKVVAAADEE